MGRPRKQEIELTETERASLGALVRSRTAPHGLVRRARIVLASAAGASNTEIAREVGLSIPAVGARYFWDTILEARQINGLP